jgi:hypothetical protein
VLFRSGGDDEFFGVKRSDDPLDGGSGKARALGDLAEAEARDILFEDAQNGGGAGDHLHAIAVLGCGLCCVRHGSRTLSVFHIVVQENRDVVQ